MLTFNLKKQWYDKIVSGEKRIEYREVKPYWTKRFSKVGANPEWEFLDDNSGRYFIPCILRLGYTKKHMTAKITKIKVVDGKETDLRIDKPVYAIYLDEVKRGTDCTVCKYYKGCGHINKGRGKSCIAWTQGQTWEI